MDWRVAYFFVAWATAATVLRSLDGHNVEALLSIEFLDLKAELARMLNSAGVGARVGAWVVRTGDTPAVVRDNAPARR